jgi:hypothetical protein
MCTSTNRAPPRFSSGRASVSSTVDAPRARVPPQQCAHTFARTLSSSPARAAAAQPPPAALLSLHTLDSSPQQLMRVSNAMLCDAGFPSRTMAEVRALRTGHGIYPRDCHDSEQRWATCATPHSMRMDRSDPDAEPFSKCETHTGRGTMHRAAVTLVGATRTRSRSPSARPTRTVVERCIVARRLL